MGENFLDELFFDNLIDKIKNKHSPKHKNGRVCVDYRFLNQQDSMDTQ